MQSEEIRQRFLEFFKKRGHEIIPSASLVPENDPSVLFNTAGMQPLVPYLMGQKYPTGATKIVNSQKCVRTGDIDEIGDNTHLTFFEMLGNWSLGDYFKKEAIEWSFELLTSKEEGFGLDASRLYVTVFEGDDNAPRDTEAHETWKSVFEGAGLDPEKRIFFMNAETNWWSPGENGPCGPDSEMFYDVTGTLNEGLTKEEFIAADDRQDIVEIWNDVFMEYEKKNGKVIGKLAQQNVDTGSGLERIVAVVQGKDNVFDTDLFTPITEVVDVHIADIDTKSKRIIADHMRSSMFLIADGVTPSKNDQGYVLRRLIRRALYHAYKNGYMNVGWIDGLVEGVTSKYGGHYETLVSQKEYIKAVLVEESRGFYAILESALRIFNKMVAHEVSSESASMEDSLGIVTAEDVFLLVTTYGIPKELVLEIASNQSMEVDLLGYDKLMNEHKEKSRAGSDQKFKGGLANSSEKTTSLHTSTHLMLAGLRKYLGEDVHQKGSNITEERLRFDFSHGEKVDRETLDKVEAYVNEAIEKKCRVTLEQMDKEKAKESGVEGSFWEKYPDVVDVYTVKSEDGTIYSQELCGGPHVENTGDIKGHFKIGKEKASSAGVRRVKATLE